MADLTEQQIKEQDIDWFCLINGHPAHIASMGGMIPETFRNREELRRQQDLVAHLEPVTEVRLNTEIIQTQVRDGYGYLADETIRAAVVNANRDNPGFDYLHNYDLPVRLYASTFVDMARRGFRSYAKREGTAGNEYILIAEPVERVRFERDDIGLKVLRCEQKEDGNSFTF